MRCGTLRTCADARRARPDTNFCFGQLARPPRVRALPSDGPWSLRSICLSAMSRDRLQSVWAAHPAPDAMGVRTIAYAHMPAPLPRRGTSYTISETTSEAPPRVARPSLVPNVSSRAIRPSLVPSIYSSYGDESAAGYDDANAFWSDLRNIQSWNAQLSATIDRLVHHQTASLSVLPETPSGQRIAAEIEAHVKSARTTIQQVCSMPAMAATAEVLRLVSATVETEL